MKKYTKEDFINKANVKYNNKFDYSLVEFIDLKTTVKIICPEHGEFNQTPACHINTNKVYGCPKCGATKSKESLKLGLDKFIIKSKTVFGELYDYSLAEYINNKTKVKLICKIHGIFEQAPNDHLRGSGCPKCAKEATKKHKTANKLNFPLLGIIKNPISPINNKIIGTIYLFRNSKNGKLYIGKTISPYNNRFAEHKFNALTKNLNNYFYRAIRKYGWDEFDKYVIFQTEELENTTDNKKLIDSVVCQKEIEFIDKLKTNNSKFGYNLTKGGDGIAGFKFSEEIKKQMSINRSGENHPNFGRKYERGTPIYQIDLFGKIIKQWKNTAEASDFLNIKSSNISKCLKNFGNSAGGYV